MSQRDYLILVTLAASSWSWLTTYDWVTDMAVLFTLMLVAQVVPDEPAKW